MELTNFYKALDATAVGMIGIFLFMLIFYIVIVGLSRLFPHKPDEAAGDTAE